jgi:Na+/proline symporter
MDSRLFLTIVAALGALYGIAFVLFPSASLALYGMSGTSAALMTQFFGAALLSVGAIAWYARDTKDWGAVRGVLIGGLVGYVVWPAPGSEDTELRCLMEQEAGHGEATVYAGVQG